jgi:hypothetical protein
LASKNPRQSPGRKFFVGEAVLLELTGLTALAALSRPFLAALSGLLTWLLLSKSVARRRVDKKISRSLQTDIARQNCWDPQAPEHGNWRLRQSLGILRDVNNRQQPLEQNAA